MPAIRVLQANPAVASVSTPTRDWLVAGSRPERLADRLDESTSFEDAIERVRSRPGEYTIICVRADAPKRVQAFRSLTSTYDLFYARRPQDGVIVVGDHFRDVLAELPVEHRTVHPSVAVDQLLFGTRPTGSYVETVGRLGHGERLDWAVDGSPRTTLVEWLRVDETADPATTQHRLDDYLESTIGGAVVDGGSATMLSGGVDSTLLHSYVETDATVSAGFDSPEFDFEVEYAREASELLDSSHEHLTFPERDYRAHLEAAIDATGLPLLLPQAVLMHLTVAETPYRTYLNGGLADGVFGTGAAAVAYLARYLGPLGQMTPGTNGESAALRRACRQLRRPATDLDGAAMNFRIHADQQLVADCVGRDRVEARKRARLRYTGRRLAFDAGAGYGAHMHLGHAIEYFHDVILTNWRHAAHAEGKAIVTPFGGRAVLEAALAVPPEHRYARFTRPPRDHLTHVVRHKYLLKDLLESKLPAYDGSKPKGHGLLPFGRYLEDGPLADVFDRYPLPAFIPARSRETVRDGTGEVTWYAANFAIWRDRVLENDALERFTTTKVVER